MTTAKKPSKPATVSEPTVSTPVDTGGAVPAVDPASAPAPADPASANEAPQVGSSSKPAEPTPDGSPAHAAASEQAVKPAAVAAPADLETQSSDDPNPAKKRVYPLRAYMDEGELRRRGGEGYLVSRDHANELKQRGLVAFGPLEE